MQVFKVIKKAIRNYFKLFDFNMRLSDVQLPTQGFFTQSEVNQLKVVLADAIKLEEFYLSEAKFNLEHSDSGVGEEFVKNYTKQKESSQKRIKMLANLAYKTKHKIIYID